jgi:hypothetical protein
MLHFGPSTCGLSEVSCNGPRDLAMFNGAIDSKLRGCDIVALGVEDIAPNGYTVDWATIR